MSLKEPPESVIALAAEPPTATTNAPFPRDEAEFGSDPRISFSKLNETYILEAEDETEYEWDSRGKRWMLVFDEAFLEQQQSAYKVPGVDDDEETEARGQKRGAQDENGNSNNKKKKTKPGKNGDAKPTERVNKAVYITNLPPDTTISELETTFSKYGLIADSIDGDGGPRIKLYRDKEGRFKGDALVVYFRPESVNLAIQMLDDTELRYGIGSNIHVQAASMEFKAHKEDPASSATAPSSTAENGESSTSASGATTATSASGATTATAPPQKSKAEKKRILRSLQRQNNKLADWSSDEDTSTIPVTLQPSTSKTDRTIILTHMFTLSELSSDPTAILDIKSDIRDECEEKCGPVTNVILYDLEEEGIVSVKFKEADAARTCVKIMDGRFFGGKEVRAYFLRGGEKFKRSRAKDDNDDGGDGEEGENGEGKERLERFGEWLEKGN